MSQIDRNNKEDLLIQTGRVKEKVCNIQRKIAKIDQEIKSVPKRLLHLKHRKELLGLKISNHEKYIIQLDNDLKKLK